MGIDLNRCLMGDKLLSKHGTILTYIKRLPNECYYDHIVEYPNGGSGTRTNDGHVFKKSGSRRESDEDIVMTSYIEIEWEDI